MEFQSGSNLVPGLAETGGSLAFITSSVQNTKAWQDGYVDSIEEQYIESQVIKRWELVRQAWQTHFQRGGNSSEANIGFLNHICYGPGYQTTPRDLTERIDAFPVFYAPGDSMLPLPGRLLASEETPTEGLALILLSDKYTGFSFTAENMEVAMLVLYATYAAWCIYDQKLISAEQVNALEEEFPEERYRRSGPQQQTMEYCRLRSAYEKRFTAFLLRRVKTTSPLFQAKRAWTAEDLALRKDFQLPESLERLRQKKATDCYLNWFWQFFFYRLIAVTGKGVQFIGPLFGITFVDLKGDYDSDDDTPDRGPAIREEQTLFKTLAVLTTNRESLSSATEVVRALSLFKVHLPSSLMSLRHPYRLSFNQMGDFQTVTRLFPGAEKLYEGDSFMAMAILSGNATLALALAKQPDYHPFSYNLGFRPEERRIDASKGISVYSDVGLLLRKRQKSNDPLWKEVLRQMIRRCNLVLPWGELHYPSGFISRYGEVYGEVHLVESLRRLMPSYAAEFETPELAARHLRRFMKGEGGALSERSEHTSLWDMAGQNTKPGYAPWKLQVLAEEGVVAVEKTPAAPMIYELVRKELGRDTQAEEHKIPALENPRPGKRRRTGQHEEVALVASGNASHPPKPYSIFPGFPSTQALNKLVRLYPGGETDSDSDSDWDY